MPRVGMNPGRGKVSDFTPARVTVVVLTYVPNDIGYFKDRFDVMRVCIESILKNTQAPFDLMVFDNGSTDKVVDYLRKQRDTGNIDFLVLSRQNIGKIGALQIMFKAAPGEIIAYCDDDVFFLPGWLNRHLEVINNYPDVGVVSGMYIKPHMKEGIESTMQFASRPDVKMEKGDLVDKDLELHYISNMGRTWEQYQKEIQGLEDVCITYKGIQTYVSAGHYQFVAVKDRILKALPDKWKSNLMGQMRELDIAIDELKMLRLCTTPATVRLLGNQINQEGAEFIRKFGIEIEGVEESAQMANWLVKVFRAPFIRKIAYFFYQRLFKIINA
ncbi:MAG: glycosyltransferase family 2 protein [Anaerolineaceae bacterium]|nr:glycosyltransferase family 2 protein [Anaerolineaceae bacterium]